MFTHLEKNKQLPKYHDDQLSTNYRNVFITLRRVIDDIKKLPDFDSERKWLSTARIELRFIIYLFQMLIME